MRAYDALMFAAEESGTPITRVCTSLGLSPNYVSVGKGRGSTPQADTLARLLGACGYDLCAVPRGQAPDNALIISD